MPTWEEFNWGSRGPAYRVGEVIVAHFFWPNTMQVNVYGHDESNDMLLNIFHVRAPGAIGEADPPAVAAVVADWVDGSYNSIYAETISSDRVVVTDVSAINSYQAELPVAAAGQQVGVPVTSNVTVAVKKSTGLSGRQNRGDWYIWPFTTGNLEILDSNRINEGFRGNITTVLEQLRTNLLTAGYVLVVASKAGNVTTEVKHFVVVDTATDSQRRRLRGRGR